MTGCDWCGEETCLGCAPRDDDESEDNGSECCWACDEIGEDRWGHKCRVCGGHGVVHAVDGDWHDYEEDE